MSDSFDIKYRPQIESGEYEVIDKYGQPVEILKWADPFIYLVVGGSCHMGDDKMKDLYINVPGTKVSRLESELKAFLLSATMDYPDGLPDEVFSQCADNLREIVKEEIEPKPLKEYWDAVHTKEGITRDILDSFDFKTIHEVMASLDWAWYNPEDGSNSVPSEDRIKASLERMLAETFSHDDQNLWMTSTGGFTVRFRTFPEPEDVKPGDRFDECVQISVDFSLEEWNNY